MHNLSSVYFVSLLIVCWPANRQSIEKHNTYHFFVYKAWFKKIDSISYVYVSWIIHDIWMIYIKF